MTAARIFEGRQGGGLVKVQRLARILTVATLGLLAAFSDTQAQTVASIAGAVTDASGAGIASATVTVRSVATGSQRVVSADSTGRYDIESLGVGQYELRVEATGFRAEVRTGIALVVGQHAEVNVTLKVGEVQESVVVQGEIPPLSVTTQDISGLVGERQV